MPTERLQKILAKAGYGSRRAAEELIEAGRVSVNGAIAKLGDKADPAKDAIKVDDVRIPAAAALIYYAVYKPRGVLSTTGGPEPRTKVTELVPAGAQLHLVGRLDKDSEGLMLLTNDGELTQRISHPRFEQEKEYRVLVARQPSADQLEAWRRGVVMEDGARTRPAKVRLEHAHGKGAWLRVIMHEGHKRQIREIAGQLGLPVVKLIRIRIAGLHVGGLKPGDWRVLSEVEVASLKAGQKPEAKPAAKRPARPRRPAGGKPSHAPGRRPSASKPGFKPKRPPAAGKPGFKPKRPSAAGKPGFKPKRPSAPGKPGFKPKRPQRSDRNARK